MLNHKTPESIFPVAFGNEEETGMIDNVGFEYDEPYKLAGNLLKYVPTELLGYRDFLTNGFRLYAGGAADIGMETNIERATPECSTPQELVAYIRAGELLIQKVVENFVAIESATDDSTVKSRIHRRVVDSIGNRKGCHDNFGIYIDDPDSFLLDNKLSLTNHLATRSFVTGAGHVQRKKLRYAQKINGLSKIVGAGYTGTMMYIDRKGYDTTSRLEIRCNDINISDWATLIRIGSTALVLAISKTPLTSQLVDNYYQHPIELAKRHNLLHIYNDLTLDNSKIDFAAVDYQQKLAELALDKLQLYVDDLPMEYFEIAKELYHYCEDYKKVARRDETIELLADRADWAAKYMLLLKNIKDDNKYGVRRRLTDIKSQAVDLRYDYIGISARSGELQPSVYGIAYKLRDRGRFKKTVSQKQVLDAYQRAPVDTRAALRADLLKTREVTYCDWNIIEIKDGATIHLRDVRASEPEIVNVHEED